MAETAAQKKARLAAAAAKEAAATKAKFEADKAAAKKARLAEEAAAIAADPDAQRAFNKVGNTGLTQAQIDASAGALSTVSSINNAYSGMGITSKIDPKTGMISLTTPVKPTVGLGTGVTNITEISDTTRDAFAALRDLFASYGLSSLADEIMGYMTGGKTAGEALIALKTNPNGAYAKRFAGNFARTKKGLNVLSESAYIELEDSYANTLRAYGLGNMLSADPNQNWKQFSEYISNDISAPEFKDRISSVQDRVVNADPAIKAMFKEFYPSLTDKDLVAYFLNPAETIGKLKEKVTSAEIGAAFTGQGLSTNLTSASDLARYGIDRAGALEGAANIASVLPESTKLGNIYGETGIKYTQETGVEEFLKSSDAAKRKRNVLASKERANFEGSAGAAQGAFSTGYLKKSSAAGLI
jgi:hypothetical protein